MNSSTLSKIIQNPLKLVQIFGIRRLLDWMPDSWYIMLTYRAEMGKPLNLKKPKTFNEKLQFLKCYDHNTTYSKYVDKVQAKQLVGSTIGFEHIVPTIGEWKSAKDINFNLLPNQFVLKCNHDQGSVIIVKNKKDLDLRKTKAFFDKRLKMNWYYGTREYAYKNIKPMVFAETFLEENIIDYKFYCFHGEPKFLYCGKGLTSDHSLKIDFYDMNWKRMPFYRTDYDRLGDIPKPQQFEEMVEIAKKLSYGFRFARIDLFAVKGKTYFSEVTFCPASGFMPFVPEKYDEVVGSWLDIDINPDIFD